MRILIANLRYLLRIALFDQECKQNFRFTFEEIVYLSELLDILDPFFAITRLSAILALAML